MEAPVANGHAELTPAQKLAAEHAAAHHHTLNVTLEDAVDEEDIAHPPPSTTHPAAPSTNGDPLPNGAPLSAKAAGKQKEPSSNAKPAAAPLDTTSQEAFPSLGAPKSKAAAGGMWGQRPAGFSAPIVNGAGRGSSTAGRTATPGISLPGQFRQSTTMSNTQLKSRDELKKPIRDILKEYSTKSKVKLDMTTGDGNSTFTCSGPTAESVERALKDIAKIVGASVVKAQLFKPSARRLAPGSRCRKRRRAHQSPTRMRSFMCLSRVTRCRQRLPNARFWKSSTSEPRTSNLRLNGIPAEFFPHLAGPRNANIARLQQGDINIKIPEYDTWRRQPPPQFAPGRHDGLQPQDGLHIQIAGEREAARRAQAEIEQMAAALRSQLIASPASIARQRHQFVLGERGISIHDFMEQTGCSVIMPPPMSDDESITIVGPPDKIDGAMEKVVELASAMYMESLDVARLHPGPQESAQSHARDLARYMQAKRAHLRDLEDRHKAQIVLPTGSEGPTAWQIFAPNGPQSMRARNDITGLIHGHPPARFRAVEIDPFYQRELKQQHAHLVRDQYGVHLVFPEEESPRVLLVYEGVTPTKSYALPRAQPAASELLEFEKSLQEAQAHLLGLIAEHGDVVKRNIDAPPQYHEKLHRYVTREGQKQQVPFPVQFLGLDSSARAIRDEKERDNVISFDFPQKFASFLIGKKGENINQLRDEFDVEIQAKDGKVEIKGPKAKAEAAKAHILAMSRKLEDETTHTLKIPPRFHGELIGNKGSKVLKMQDKYNVRILFPRNAVTSPDTMSVADGASDAGRSSLRPQVADEVIIKGPRKGADEARAEILDLYQWEQDHSFSATVLADQSQLPSLIGKGGRELIDLRASTGAKIDIPSRDAVSGTGKVEIKLRGTKEAVDKAKRALESKVKTMDATVSQMVDVHQRHHRSLIGRDGENLRRLISEAGGPEDAASRNRTIQMPARSSSDTNIKVEGEEAVVAKIIAAILAHVALEESRVTETLEVDPSKHNRLIGRGGEVRRSIEADHAVNLNIPRATVTGPARSQVTLVGTPEAVAAARARILELTKEAESVQVAVPRHLHHAVAESRNGNFISQLRRDHKVHVDHGGQKPPAKAAQSGAVRSSSAMPLITDEAPGNGAGTHSWNLVDLTADEGSGDIPWILKGEEAENLAKARAMIEAAVAAAQEQVTGYLLLPDPSLHRLVIGRGGATVQKIRSRTGCQVNVPQAGKGDEEAIVIRGSRAGVEQAKEMILEEISRARR
ncbi:hypothetical protein MRB53_041566 [Persea americana]|nr:hypothetical protein MRB53_041566 [Persea americana]